MSAGVALDRVQPDVFGVDGAAGRRVGLGLVDEEVEAEMACEVIRAVFDEMSGEAEHGAGEGGGLREGRVVH